MPTCQTCGSFFPNKIKIEGVCHTLSSRKLCLECSPWGMHNTRSSEELQLYRQGLYRCSCCKQYLQADAFYWGKKRRQFYCKKCDEPRRIARFSMFKQKLLEYRGSSCVICGYSRCPSAIHFHHLDPKQKEFGISHYSGVFDDKVRSELDKCVPLCNRCHSEVHAGMTKLPALI